MNSLIFSLCISFVLFSHQLAMIAMLSQIDTKIKQKETYNRTANHKLEID
jgi:hypothetical protein